MDNNSENTPDLQLVEVENNSKTMQEYRKLMTICDNILEKFVKENLKIRTNWGIDPISIGTIILLIGF